MLKVLAGRALIDPIVPARSRAIELTDRVIPTVGRIVGLGRSRCPDCGATIHPDIHVGALVLVPPTSGQEVLVDDHAYWIVPIGDLVAEWQEPV